ncbi:hypothetical protein D1007_21235 [Hordeum vulgare]|nr:hypothetical protein D1007_21235 [Hordeum vulgare]
MCVAPKTVPRGCGRPSTPNHELSHPMASVLEIPQQLAPTMGPTVTMTGVTFRAGPFTPSGERVAHGLVMRYGALDCVNDNARRLEDANFPVDGSITTFAHTVSTSRSSPSAIPPRCSAATSYR